MRFVPAPVLIVAALLGGGRAGAQPPTPAPEEAARLARIVANNHAKRICSEHFLGGRDPSDVLREDQSTDPATVGVKVRRRAGVVEVMALGATGRAAYRPGLGCTILHRLDPRELRERSVAELDLPEADPSAPWPAGSKVTIETPTGLDRAALEAALDDAFAEPDAGKRRGTRAAFVVWNGKVVAERYAPGFASDRPLIAWSMTKSVIGALIGTLVRDGKLDLHAPAPVPEWQAAGDPRRAITLDQLLRMSSGLAFEEIYQAGLIDVVEMLFAEPDAAAFAASRPLEAPPDTVWHYSSGTTNILSRIVRQAVGGTSAEHVAFPRRALLDALGMNHTVIELDESGTFVGSSFMYSTARDLARFGQLYLQDGVWAGRRILPEGWVRYSTTPTAAAPRGEYGAQLWLNAGAPGDAAKRQWPSVPTDAYGLSGFEGQSVTVVPSRQAVIVRLGRTVGEGAFDLDPFLAAVLHALPGGR